MKEKKFMNKREWLNRPDHYDSGAVHTKVYADGLNVDAEVCIWDCSRKITLNFRCDEKDVKERAEKLNKLISHLTEMRDAMGKAYEYHLEVKDDSEDDY